MLRVRCFVFLLLAALAVSCTRETAQPPRADVPVFILSIDTLRADRLPAYGYAKGSTPALDAFRRDAILFTQAYSNVPLTLPSHASIFTGELPYVHGVRNNLGYTLDAARPTLASKLKAKGYETGAAVSSFVLRKETGIAAGFDFFDDYMTHSPLESATSWQRDGDLSRQSLASWLQSKSGAKVFGFLHLYEPHSPYTPPAPFSNAADRYDGEISYADAIAGRFFDDLKKRNLYDSALIIVLSDHGEGLGDHGEPEHGIFVYREAIHVPLLVKLPAQQRKGETVERVVGLTDVLPTVLDVTGEPAPSSLLAAAPQERAAVYSESYYPRLQYGWSELTSMIDANVHYIDAPHVELYRYPADAAERQNVAEQNRREVAAFREELRKAADAHPFVQPQLADPEDAAKLAALGYVGSTVSASGPLPDPKDKLDVLRAFGAANDELRMRRFAKAAEIMEPLMRANPDFVSGWGALAQAYRELGRKDLALETLRTQMNHSPGNAQVALAIADLLLEMGRYNEAREHALLAKEAGGAFVQETLARIAMAARDFAGAETAANASLAAEPDRIQALMLLSEVRRAQQRAGEELALLERAKEVTQRRRLPAIRDLDFRRGEALLRSRRVPEAEQAFRAETQAFADNLPAWANLSLVVAAQGQGEEARAILEEMMRRNPGRAAGRLAVEALGAMNDEAGARALAARLGR
ncbi:MAG TPA: sulfatase-like hydrolase/transferase [Thermoanaerobaculia bacterium]|nr:sulfatase-like hydrolase/transferase [Thermoanaerobaculia bacterium]